MIGTAIALSALIALVVLALRLGVDSGKQSSWSPPSDWRERDPRS